ncbi:MAG TPA: hypothetical protein VL326_20085 [Kofleriaceae bacterium]|jgi:hypothetical protein|nr:hypothetical protein [Kofleriaceae bacterium]
MRWRLLAASIVLASATAHAQGSDPLDEKQLAETLATITQDPAVKVTDPNARPLATALMTEGVKQLQAEHYDQALANFLEAYSKFPSPKILLNIASTLAEMHRLADAANTYQRYLTDPATGPERIAEVKQILVDLDTKLTLLTVRVQPKGSEVSIDAGPFIAVGTALVTRVRPGIHLVRVRNRLATGEVTVNGFEGEAKDIELSAVATVSQGTDTTPPAEPPPPPPPVAEQVNGWLVDGTRYGTADATSNERHVRATFQGPELRAVVPSLPVETDDPDIVVQPVPVERQISSGVAGMLRVDGKGRGVAGGLGFALAPWDSVELELDALRSNIWGLYAGARLRFLTGWVRPYVGGGIPMFFFEDETDMQNTAVFGLRGALGVELRINGHISLQGDVGFEHFFNVEHKLLDGKRPDANLFVPTLGVIGRL